MPDDPVAGDPPGWDPSEQATQSGPGTPVWRPFRSPERLGLVESTNSLLAARARGGALEGTVLVAESQRAGRGRLGRRWLDPPGGSLLCSILFRPRFPPTDWHLAPLVVSLAARRAAEEVAGVSCLLKWPNDLVAGPEGKKVAGLLSETAGRTEQGRPAALVVGIGVNCNWPPGFPPPGSEGDEVASRAAPLGHLAGRPVDREALCRRLLEHVAAGWESLGGGERPAPGARAELFAAYRAFSATLGQRVEVELAGELLTGRAVDVDEEGRLLVESGGEVRSVSAGDVVHLRGGGRGEAG